MIMPSITAAILLLTFCSWARAVPACVRGTGTAATTSSGRKVSIILAQLTANDSGTDQGLSSTQGPRKSDGFHATTSKSHSWSSSNFDGSIRITTAVAPTQATWAAQALTSAAHTAESSSSSDLPAISEKIATSAAQVSNIAATTRQVTLTKATAVSSGKASSAAPPVSATGTGSSSSKMGVSWPVQEKDASPIAQFFVPTSTVSWWFDWNKNWNQSILSADGVSISGQFIPMLFDRNFLDNSDTLQDGFTEIMGYNEPDLRTDSGVSSYIDPVTAGGIWKTQITKLRSTYPSIKVQSPVMAFNQTWLSTFFATICPPPYSAKDGWGDCSYKPDYVAMHLYTTDPDEFMSTVSTFQKTFGLPLVLSEFACYSFGSSSNPSAADVSFFMQKTISWLEKQPWLVRYAWFGAIRDSTYLYGVAETNRLMDPTGQLTNLGKQYMNGGQLL
ncbi:hypothetical protein CNBG_3129 [Cryptococcus deuterogattii R265]|uniref:uncharacterized protein n=1 Tax=Cryptococcus deuterogattii (strain R265) TaxID=294750 RepID=UPI001934B6B0|nr:hypothetical protein CNBG_3129 [Cryptococcus deuterogattii R265]